MPGAMPPPTPSPTAAPKPVSFNSNAPGAGAQVAGTNFAMQNLQKAAGLSGDTTNFQQQQLGQQLQNNQSNIQQNLTNRGLGNTTIADTMQQAPLQTYNMGMAQVGDLSAQRQMQAYGNLANAAMQGGNAITQTAQPYAQSNFAQGIQQQQQAAMQRQQAIGQQNQMGMQPFGQQPQGQQQQQAPQGQQQGQGPASLYYQGPGAPSNLGGGQTPEQSAQANLYPWLAGNPDFAQGGGDSGGY